MPDGDSPAMSAHLAEISRTIAKGAPAILVLDGAVGHGGKALCVSDNITLLYRPRHIPRN